MAASQRLAHLLQLADQGPTLRAALAEEVAELLTAWPADYPDSMRGVCEALLIKAARDIDAPTRARLRVQLYADPDLAARVLPREPAAAMLVETARRGGDIHAALSRGLGVPAHVAREILDDDSGEAMVIACKGAGIDRASFSALLLLTGPRRDRAAAYALLDVFDTVPSSEAARRLDAWRETLMPQAHVAA